MSRTFRLDATQFKAMQQEVQTRLVERFSTGSDEVLPEYIMVMVQNQKPQPDVAKDLEAFLGKENATAFSVWLWTRLALLVSGRGVFGRRTLPCAAGRSAPATIPATHSLPARPPACPSGRASGCCRAI